MLITKPNLQVLQTSFSSKFRSAYRDTSTFWNRLATRIPSSTKVNTYGWMQRLLEMRRWLGPRVIQNLKTHSYLLENEPFELTVAVDKHNIQDDELGVYSPLFEEMGRQGKRLPDQLVLEALRAGNTTGVGFDGNAFYSTGHVLDPAGTQDNTGTETMTAANWGLIRAEMNSYTGEDGRPLAVNPRLVVAGPSFQTRLKEIFTAERNANGSTNVTQGEAQYLIIPELTLADGWFVFDDSAPMKALIWQDREAVTMVTKTSMTDDSVFWQRQFVWGLEGRGVVGYGPWWLSYHATGGLA